MAELIRYHARKVMPELIGAEVRKLGREDAARYLRAIVDENVSIYLYMTLEDEAGLLRATDEFVPDLAKESAIVASFLQYLEHVRQDINPGLIANLVKVFVLTAESREELHESAYKETLEVQINTILNLIFEET